MIFIFLKLYKDFLPKEYIIKNNKKVEKNLQSYMLIVIIINLTILIFNINMKNQYEDVKKEKYKLVESLKEENTAEITEKQNLTEKEKKFMNILENYNINDFNIYNEEFSMIMDDGSFEEYIKEKEFIDSIEIKTLEYKKNDKVEVKGKVI